MPYEERDAAHVWDMLDYARATGALVRGKTLADYGGDRGLRLATERALEVLGEAARHVSEAFRRTHPEIPWSRIIGLRNILAHDYGEILDDKVWEVATRAVPELIRKLEPLVPPTPLGEEPRPE